MKRIVICFDGTWSKPADEALPADGRVETNVCRFYESIKDKAADGTKQVKWYDEGVGTQWYDRFIGGSIGAGLELNIVQGYEYLAQQYEAGDEVYVLGFSRGAYTARSLVGMIRNCGLIYPKHLTLRVGMAYGIYRTRGDNVDSFTAKIFRAAFCREIKIKFVGVWDTVGALGIPLTVLKDVNMKFYEFHDTNLSNIVENAYHALAIDEHRQDYMATLWNPDTAPQQKLEQRWFVGAHCDVGGGYKDRRLSDLTLSWMQQKAQRARAGARLPCKWGRKIIWATGRTLTASFSTASMPKKIRVTIGPSAPLSSVTKSSMRRCSNGVRKSALTSRKIMACRS